MLQQIQLKNYIAIEQQELNFTSGLICFTGETGAGKSIWINAIAIACGQRCDKRIIRPGAKQCSICISFDVSQLKSAQQWLQQHGFTDEPSDAPGDAPSNTSGDLDENTPTNIYSDQPIAAAAHTQPEATAPMLCVIRRSINQQGRSRYYINDTACTLASIKQLAPQLMQMHTQHVSFSMQQPKQQLHWLDYQLDLKNRQIQQKTADYFHVWQKTERELIHVKQQQQSLQQQHALLHYQLQELKTFSPKPNEWETLHQQQRALQQHSETQHAYQVALEQLQQSETANCLQLLHTSLKALKNSPLNQEKTLQNICHSLEQAQIEIEEACSDLQALQQADDTSLAQPQIEQRLQAMHQLARKHQVKPEELAQQLSHIEQRLQQSDQLQQQLQQLEETCEQQKNNYMQTAQKLSLARQRIAKILQKKLSDYMQQLAMPKSYAEIQVHSDPQHPHATGLDQVQINISTNPQQPAQALHKVASGGELSRIALAMAVINADRQISPCLIFDEIDSGIGGQTGHVVGKLLQRTSQKRQVVCITHLTQVAHLAQQHIQVSKNINSQNNQVNMRAKILTKTQRKAELARMVGGLIATEH